MELARATTPSLAVFSLKCGVSDTTEEGIATHNCFRSRVECKAQSYYRQLPAKDESYCLRQLSSPRVTLTLDDLAAIRRVDESNMLSLMEKTADRLVVPREESTCKFGIGTPRNVVLAGLGGSGIVGEVLADYCRDLVHECVTICRFSQIPKFVDKDTFFVAISYSGETGETLRMFEQARAAGAKLAAVCSGGKLLEEAKKIGVPYVKVPSGMLPRVALPELIAAVTHVLGQAKVLENTDRMLELARASTREVLSKVDASIPLQQNPAKQLASALMGRLPILLGDEAYVSVLRRFKNQLNENSKLPAFLYTLPEAFHNDIEGLSDLRLLSKPQPVILRSQSQTEVDRKVMERLLDILTGFEFPNPLFLDGIGSGRFEWLLTAITLGDFVSFYLAILKGVDPSKLAFIPQFRAIRGRG